MSFRSMRAPPIGPLTRPPDVANEFPPPRVPGTAGVDAGAFARENPPGPARPIALKIYGRIG